MKITDLAILVKCEDGQVYEVLLGNYEQNVIKNTLEHIYPHKIEVSEPLNSITIEELKQHDVL